ncbi:retropepsin-like domain-containing protein [Candidatus Bipolaricaulota bacterium]|nr:retropepsin-like domain-containing protein [Candidatus Bipolaricaulota bacterium]
MEPGTWTVRIAASNCRSVTDHFSIPSTSALDLDRPDLGIPPLDAGASSGDPPDLAPEAPPSPATGTVRLGDCTLRVTDYLKCVSERNRPYAAVIVRLPGQKTWLTLPRVLIDSGADSSFFPLSVAQALELDLSVCPTITSTGVGGDVLSYVAEVELAIIHLGGIEEGIDGYILGSNGSPLHITARASFAPGEGNEGIFLLGGEDVFDRISITFTGDAATLRIPDQGMPKRLAARTGKLSPRPRRC